MSAPLDLPRWADVALVPAISVASAFLVAGLVVIGIGENPLQATRILVAGSLGSGEGLGFTLFYATNFIFTGLAVAVAFGAARPFIPGYLQAKHGSHVVITTIRFNWLASVLLVYLLVEVLREPASMNPETPAFSPGAQLPFMHDLFAAFGIEMPRSQLNVSLLLALVAAFGVWLLIYRSRLGYALRVVGANPTAASYAGISLARVIM